MVIRRLCVLAALLLSSGCTEPWANEDLTELAAPLVFRSITVATERSCGLDDRGRAWCWGGDAASTTLRELCYFPASFPFDEQWIPCWKRPAPVAGGHIFTELKAGALGTWGLDTEGKLWAWGENAFKLLHSGAITDRFARMGGVAVVADKRFRTMDPGAATMCGITTGGEIWCWGEPDMITTNTPLQNTICPGMGGYGNCGVAPVRIGAATDWVEIGVGIQHACARNAAGRIYCWGLGEKGQLGVTATPTCVITGISVRCSSTPLLVSASLTFQSMSVEGNQSCGITTAHELYCWGEFIPNSSGMTIPVSLGPNFTQVNVSGRPGICAIRVNGTAWCTGVIGNATNLAQIPAPGPYVGSAATLDHACLWNAAGDAWCFGDKAMGQLGDGISANVFGPTLYQVGPPFKH